MMGSLSGLGFLWMLLFRFRERASEKPDGGGEATTNYFSVSP